MAQVGNKFECRVTPADRREIFHTRIRGDQEVALHFAAKGVEVGFQDRQLLRFDERTQAKFLPLASLLERDFSSGLGVAHPLRSPARSHQILLSIQFEQVDWSRVELASFPSANL